MLKNKNCTLDDFFSKIKKAQSRICTYVYSKLKTIFIDSGLNLAKQFVKNFFDILLSLLESTIQRMIRLIKSIFLAVIDSIKIIKDKNASRAQKSDSIFNLFATTVSTFVIEIIFEILEKQFSIPDWLAWPFQLIVTVLVINLVMLVLQKADLFDVKYGLLISNIEKIFNEEMGNYKMAYQNAEKETDEEVKIILEQEEKELRNVQERLKTCDIYSDFVQENLKIISENFNMEIDFSNEWSTYLGIAM